MEKIFVNIWDDYHDDGYIPEGEIQETYAYVECELSDEKSKEVLEIIQSAINELYQTPPFEMELHYYDSSKKYPELVGTPHEHFLYKRWQIQFKHMTHQVRENLVDFLQKQKILFNDIPLTIYSES